MYMRAKRVSGPLDDRVKARLRGEHASSGSEHEAAEPLFSGPIHAFLDIGHHHHHHDRHSDDANEETDVGGADSDSYDGDALGKAMRALLERRIVDPFLVLLHRDVTAILAAAEWTKRSVAARLRECGYNAGACKARWGSSGSSLTAGSYEYVDVVVVGEEQSRYIVDVGFDREFTVARPTEEYTKLLAALPRVMVGGGEQVEEVVRIMAEAAKRSMRSRDLSVPPWRKRRYMLAKWFGPYRRTTNANALPSISSAAAAAQGVGEMVKWRRAVGFVVAATRTS